MKSPVSTLLFALALLALLSTPLACRDRVNLKVKVGVRDAGLASAPAKHSGAGPIVTSSSANAPHP